METVKNNNMDIHYLDFIFYFVGLILVDVLNFEDALDINITK